MTVFRERLVNLGLRVRRAGWKTWLVVGVLILAVAWVLKMVLTGGGLLGGKAKTKDRARREAEHTAGILETAVANARDKIQAKDKELAERQEELAEIKSLDNEVERLRRLAELSNRTARGRNHRRPPGRRDPR